MKDEQVNGRRIVTAEDRIDHTRGQSYPVQFPKRQWKKMGNSLQLKT